MTITQIWLEMNDNYVLIITNYRAMESTDRVHWSQISQLTEHLAQRSEWNHVYRTWGTYNLIKYGPPLNNELILTRQYFQLPSNTDTFAADQVHIFGKINFSALNLFFPAQYLDESTSLFHRIWLFKVTLVEDPSSRQSSLIFSWQFV